MRTNAVSEDDSFAVPVVPEWRGRWCRIVPNLPSGFRPRIMSIRAETLARDPDADTYYLDLGRAGRARRLRPAIVFVPGTACTLRITTFGQRSLPDTIAIHITPVPKWYAAAVLACRWPAAMLAAMQGGIRGIERRVRTTMAIVSTGTPPVSYLLWAEFFDTWYDRRIDGLLASERRTAWPSIAARIYPGNGSKPAAMEATLASLQRQAYQATQDASDADYIALIQAGELIPKHALALLADWVVRLDWPDAIYADEDRMTADGERHAPLFKPEPNHTLMLSGTLSTGIWLVRRSCLAEPPMPAGRWAAAARLETWLRLHERDRASKTHRVPYIATHRGEACEAEPTEAMAALVEDHLRRLAVNANVERTWPIRVQPFLPSGHEPHVTIIVPSACRSSHVTKCLSAVATGTSYPRFDILVVVSQQSDFDDQQKRIIGGLKYDPRIEVVHHRIAGGFNFSAANNHALGFARGSLLCLLNDDVAPVRPDWLTNLVGHFAYPDVGAVGAKLYYPNDRVQHGGVIIGLSGLCDHMNRLLPRNAAGYAHRGVLDQQLSAVTAACLLIDRSLYEAVGGLDERYASAFNDIDLCLKVGAAGRSVIFSAGSELYHYESLSFIRHYADTEFERWAADVRLMRERWGTIVANDPFHNPNLSLQRGNEWEPAFPPRLPPWSVQDTARTTTVGTA